MLATAPSYLLSWRGRAPDPQRVILHLDARPRGPTLVEYRHVLAQLPRLTTVELRCQEGSTPPLLWPLLQVAAERHRVDVHLDAGTLGERQIGELLQLAPRRALHPGLVAVTATVRGDGPTHDRLIGREGDAKRLTWALRTLADRRDSAECAFPQVVVRAVLDERTAPSIQASHALAKAAHANRFHLAIVPGSAAALAPPGSDRLETLAVDPPPAAGIDAAALGRELLTIDASRKYGWEGMELTIDHGLEGREEVLAHLLGAPNRPLLRCSAPWRWVQVSPTGDVYLCPRFSVGNISSLPLSDLYHGIVACGFRRQLRRARSFPACRGCEGAAAHSRLG